MELSLYLFMCFELLGTVAFAVSGAMVAIEKKADIFGVLVLGIITATGGGMLRDTLLGNLPPRLFSNSLYVAVAACAALLLFLLARLFREVYVRKAKTVDQVNNFFDALGLGAFTITDFLLIGKNPLVIRRVGSIVPPLHQRGRETRHPVLGSHLF